MIFLVLALFVTLSSTDELVIRIKTLLRHWHYFNVDPIVEQILRCLLNDDIATIKKPHVLGEGYQNKMARLNGIKHCGWFEYKRQMHSMTQNTAYSNLKNKYHFLNELENNTLGGGLKDFLRSDKLSLPGEAGGSAEFFLWHDTCHVLSGNKTDSAGELGANAFTAGCVDKCKFRVLLFGLLQWNLGVPLAIVAEPNKNQFTRAKVIRQYLYSLLVGSKSEPNLLDWPVDKMVEDFKMDLNQVRKKYNIKPIPDDLYNSASEE